MVPDLPELLVGANVTGYLRHFYRAWSYQTTAFTPEDIAVYVHAFSQPGGLRAGFADYRAGGTTDLEHDQADAGRRIKAPTLVLWGRESQLEASGILEIWREVADDVQGEAIPESGHFLAEEQPERVAAALLQFLP
jgi:pimeloyl-ACP methyl ester carboxylesterase